MIKQIIHNLEYDGVSVIKNVYNREQINNLIKLSQSKYNYFINNQDKMKLQTYDYYTHFDKEYCDKKNYYEYNDLKIIELAKGRYDISFSTDLLDSPIINDVIDHFIKKEKKMNYGLLTSEIDSKEGQWHRDTVNLNGDPDNNGNYDDSIVHNIRPFYFTILIPLVPLTKENGSTEFIKGSHKLTYNEINNCEHIQLDTEIGDIIIFDWKIFHRGRKNNSQKSRPILYNIIYRSWYSES